MKNPSVSQYIVSALAQAGVQRVYGIVGDSLNGLTEAVRRMLPKSKLGRAMLAKLKVYAGPDHPHTAQQPEPTELAIKA